VTAAALVAEQRRRSVEVIDHNLEMAVVVQVPEGAPAGDALRGDSKSGFRRDIDKASVAAVAVKQAGLFIGDMQLTAGDLGVYVTVG